MVIFLRSFFDLTFSFFSSFASVCFSRSFMLFIFFLSIPKLYPESSLITIFSVSFGMTMPFTVAESVTVKGIVMPNETENIVIKLDSGYNFGIERKKIKSIKLLEKHTEAKEEKKEKVKSKKDLKNITILHTGGTIASKVDYTTGGVVSRFEPQEIIEMFPELRDIVNIDSRLIGNMWSEDMRFIHFQKIAKEIIKEIKNKKDGVI